MQGTFDPGLKDTIVTEFPRRGLIGETRAKISASRAPWAGSVPWERHPESLIRGKKEEAK